MVDTQKCDYGCLCGFCLFRIAESGDPLEPIPRPTRVRFPDGVRIRQLKRLVRRIGEYLPKFDEATVQFFSSKRDQAYRVRAPNRGAGRASLVLERRKTVGLVCQAASELLAEMNRAQRERWSRMSGGGDA